MVPSCFFERVLVLLCTSFLATPLYAGDTLRVLFVGNSYTYYNSMPQTVASLAAASGDHLIFSSSAVGGYTLQQHSADANTKALIAQGNWDFVSLQEQSQYPSFPDNQVQAGVVPFAKRLDSLIKVADTCTKTVFFMTWGRKNGDQLNCASFPPVCTYQGMDSLLQLRYTMLADSNNAVLNPVAKVWRHIRNNYPAIDLYDADESHPSAKGSFAIATAFYTVLFKKNPVGNTFNGGLASSEANIIKQVVNEVIYDSLSYWYRFYPSVNAAFSFTKNGNTVSFQNSSANAAGYQWYFGDGNTSTQKNPTHTYSNQGSFQVKLVAKRCEDADTAIQQVAVGSAAVATTQINHDVHLFPNPVHDILQITAAAKILKVRVFDVAGAERKSVTGLRTTETTLNLGDLAPGVYLVSVVTEQGVIHQRVLLQH
jgi:hypothetical protein